jgi:hypothetical protein
MSIRALVSLATRLLASLENATRRPSADGADMLKRSSSPVLLPWFPCESTLTRTVSPVCRSCTKMSATPLVSPATRLLAQLVNDTYRPSGVSDGNMLGPLP